jgi:hypothetical protein
MKFLKVEDCYSVALKMNQVRLCLEYGYCLEKGIKQPSDVESAVQIYKHLLKESLINDDKINLAKILLRFARIFERRKDIDKIQFNLASGFATQKKSEVLCINSIQGLIDKTLNSKPFKVIKTEMYLIGSILMRLDQNQGNIKMHAIEAFKIAYQMPCGSNLDYVLNYKIESKLKSLVNTFGALGVDSKELDFIRVKTEFDSGIGQKEKK